MAQNDITSSGTVVWQGGDGIDEADLARTAARSNQTDYVERGLGVTYDGANDTIDIESGHAIIEDSNQAYDVFPDQETGINLPNTGGNNYVYLVHDPATDDDVQYHVDDDDSAPSDPSLRIAVVDANAGNVSEKRRDPRGSFEALDTEQIKNVYDYVISTDDDIADILSNQLSTGESAWIGKGTHEPTSTIQITDVDDFTIHGPGTSNVVIKNTNALSPVMQINGTGFDPVFGVQVGGFAINCNSQGGDGLVWNCKEFRLHDIRIDNSTANGFKFTDAFDGSVRDISAFSCGDDANTKGGVKITGASGDGGNGFAQSNSIDFARMHLKSCESPYLAVLNGSFDIHSRAVHIEDVAAGAGITIRGEGSVVRDSFVNPGTAQPAGTPGVLLEPDDGDEPVKFIDSEVQAAQGPGVKSENTSIIRGVSCIQNQDSGVLVATPASQQTVVSECKLVENNQSGGNKQGGVRVESPQTTVRDCEFTDEQSTPTQDFGVILLGGADGSRVINPITDGNEPNETINYNSGSDMDVIDADFTSATLGAFATRERVDGVIGGGPLGGVDLSATTGQFEGDLAVADGSSSANAGDLARWDSGNSQWEVFQPATTV